MNRDTIEGSWKQFTGKVKAQWGKFTGHQPEVIGGKRVEVSGKIRHCKGRSRAADRQSQDTIQRLACQGLFLKRSSRVNLR